jgi:hypothetical protein
MLRIFSGGYFSMLGHGKSVKIIAIFLRYENIENVRQDICATPKEHKVCHKFGEMLQFVSAVA